MSTSLIVYGVLGLVGAVLAFRGLSKPFLGLIVLMSLHFIQPGEMIPALAPLRIELVYGILMLVIVLRKRSSEIKEILRTDKIVRATILLEGVIVLTVPLALWRSGAFAMALEVSKMVMLQLLMTVLIDSKDRLRTVFWFLVVLMMWFSGSTLSAYMNGEFYVVNGVERAQGLNSMVGDPNALAGFLVSLLPFSIALIAVTRKFFGKALLLACAGLSLVMLLFTGARISLLALIAMLLLYIIRSKHKIQVLALCVTLAIVAWSLLPAQYRARYLTIKQYAEGGELDASNELRLQIWDVGWHMIQKYPVLGVGAGQFSTAYGMFFAKGRHIAWMQPHNLWLQVTCELGIVGLLVFCNLLFQIARGIKKTLDHVGDPEFALNYHFAEACLFMFVGVGVLSFVSHVLYRPYWYMLAGLVSADVMVCSNILKDRRAFGSNQPESPVTVPKQPFLRDRHARDKETHDEQPQSVTRRRLTLESTVSSRRNGGG
jgi:putative inorganic carbon (hco3(-)) transporter